MKFLLFAAAALSAASPALAAQIQTYDYPRPVRYSPGDTVRDTHRNPEYVVRVRAPSGVWQDLYEHRVEVDWNNPQSAALVRFDFEGKVELAIQRSYAGFSKVAVRPASLGIQPRIEDDTVYLTLDKPANLSVEFDGDKHHNLHVFAGAIDNSAKPQGPGVIVFGPGVHKPPKGEKVFRFASGQTVLIDGAAVLDAGISLDHVHDVTIKGHGLIERPTGDVPMTNTATHDNTPEAHVDGTAAIGIRNSRNIRIEGLTIINPPGVTLGCMQSSGVSIVDLKSFSARPWADGIDIYSCRDVEIDRVFLRVADDCFALYNHRWDLYGDIRRVRVTNSTCWADVAHAMYMGLFGNPDRPEVTEDVTFKNIDVLEINETQPRFQGVMAINANNATVVRNILFEDIRVDHMIEGKLFNFAVIGDDRFSLSPGGGIANLTLRNISFTGKGVYGPSVIQGYDQARGVRGVTLENVRIGQRKLTAPDAELLQVGPHATDIRFK
nr:glycosyl hydrolase family 28 protein [Duganella guangzhouensis]